MQPSKPKQFPAPIHHSNITDLETIEINKKIVQIKHEILYAKHRILMCESEFYELEELFLKLPTNHQQELSDKIFKLWMSIAEFKCD